MRATAVDASHRRAATLSRQGGAVGGGRRSAVGGSAGQGVQPQPGKPHPAHRVGATRGSRAETTGRATPVAVVGGTPKRDGSAWGRSPRPRKQKARASGSAQTRPACRAETLARAFSGPRSGIPKGRGRRYLKAHDRASSPGKHPDRRPAGGKGVVSFSRLAAVRSPCSVPVALGHEQLAALYES